MAYVKWTLLALVALVAAAFLHYTLPQRDVVRVVSIYQERIDFGDWTRIFWARPDDQAVALANRDVQFIQTVDPRGRPRVYRNENTGWSWPPYFKFDTANLQTQAADLASTAENPRWVAITHYGWRSELLTIFPNAVAIRPVDGPDAAFFPWVNVIILTALAGMVFLLWRIWRQFRERTIDPALARAGDALGAVDDRADAARDRAARWWHRMFGPPRR